VRIGEGGEGARGKKILIGRIEKKGGENNVIYQKRCYETEAGVDACKTKKGKFRGGKSCAKKYSLSEKRKKKTTRLAVTGGNERRL